MTQLNLIPAAQDFECTHGRVGSFLLSIKKNHEADKWKWSLVFAGSPRVCPESLLEVITSPEDFETFNQCLLSARTEAQRLSDIQFNDYLIHHFPKK